MLDGLTVPLTKFCINMSTRGKMTFWKCVTRDAPKKKFLVLVFYGASLC